MSQHQILLVDDDPAQLNAVARGFQLAGYSVTTANDPVVALGLLQAGRQFDAIVSDYEMPNMNGDVFCERARPLNNKRPFILVSGHAAIHRFAYECGADRAFMKPVTPRDLRDAVAELIAASRPV